MRRVLIVQYAGDFADAYRRMQCGEGETYYGHRYLLNSMAALGGRVGEVALMSNISPQAFDVVLAPGLRAIGGGPDAFDSRKVTARIAAYDPTHLILQFPDRRVISWAAGRPGGMRTALVLADSFTRRELRQRIAYRLLARALNRPRIELIGNHGIKASLSLAAIGTDPTKVVPWDFVYTVTPDGNVPRTLHGADGRLELPYGGRMRERRGGGARSRAGRPIRPSGRGGRARLAGSGDVEEMRALASAEGVAGEVELVGHMPHTGIYDFIRSGHVAVVPSRHDYMEGFPLTIYEALTTRTPIVASDHPMFVGNLEHRQSALLFPAADPTALADRILDLTSDGVLYERLSRNAAATWHGLQLPVKWAELISRWVDGRPEDLAFIGAHTLRAPLYAARVKAYGARANISSNA